MSIALAFAGGAASVAQAGVIDVTFVFTNVSAVPEPATWGMMLLGFVGLGFAFRQSRRKESFA
jgi:hypothetical protein